MVGMAVSQNDDSEVACFKTETPDRIKYRARTTPISGIYERQLVSAQKKYVNMAGCYNLVNARNNLDVTHIL